MEAVEVSGKIARRRPARRHLLVALALANLIYYPVWQGALHYSDEYYYDTPIPGRGIFAAALSVLALAALLWGAAQLAAQQENDLVRRLARCAFLAALLIPLNHIRTNLGGTEASGLLDLVGKSAVGLGVLAILLGIYLTLRGSTRASLAAQFAILIFLPYAAMTFGQGAWVLLGGRDAQFRRAPLAEAVEAGPAPDRARAVWIIFDQLDQELSFEARPADVPLPALDRLRSEAFAADQAYAPAGWTIVSLPALLTGRLVEQAKPASASALWLKFADQEEPERWGSQPTVFSRARAHRLNTALVGNYHPYCRILAGDLVACYSVSYRQGVPEPCASVLCEAVRQVVGLVYRLPLMDRLRWLRRRYHALHDPIPWDEAKAGIVRYRRIHERAIALAGDPKIDLVFLHYPVPHGPVIFSRRTDDFLRAGQMADRFDNMVLADHALAELRAAMERAGVWDRSAVVVSADHGEKDIADLAFDAEGRRIDRRVPFIVKLPYRSTPLRYRREMNTVATQDAVLAVLEGAIATENDLASWLDRHVGFGRSPVFPGNAD